MVLGAAVLHLGEDMLRKLTITIGGVVIAIGDYWALALGVSFIVIVLVLPQGVVGSWLKWRYRQKKE